MAAFFEIVCTQDRTVSETITLYQEDGSTGIALAADDVVRFKMGRRTGSTPTLDLDTIAATANGSKCDVSSYDSPAMVTVTLAQDDLTSMMPGIYDAQVVVVDNSVVSPFVDPAYVASNGIVSVLPGLGGDKGLT